MCVCVCVHTWAYVTGRPAETSVLRVAPGNAGESNLGSVKAGEMCLSAPRELVSRFLFDRLKLWHQPAPQPPPLTTPSSSSKATTPAVHIAAIYLQLVPFLQTFFLTWHNVILTAWVMVLTSRIKHILTSHWWENKLKYLICLPLLKFPTWFAWLWTNHYNSEVFMAWCVCWFRECIRPNLLMDHLC